MRALRVLRLAALCSILLTGAAAARLDLGPDPLPEMQALDEMGDVWASYRALRCAALFDAMDRLDLAPSRLDGGPARNARALTVEFAGMAERAWRLGAHDAELDRPGFWSGISIIRDARALMSESYGIRIAVSFVTDGRGPGSDSVVGRDLAHCSAMVGLTE